MAQRSFILRSIPQPWAGRGVPGVKHESQNHIYLTNSHKVHEALLSQQLDEGSFIISTLQMYQLRPRKVKQVAKGHTASNGSSGI